MFILLSLTLLSDYTQCMERLYSKDYSELLENPCRELYTIHTQNKTPHDQERGFAEEE